MLSSSGSLSISSISVNSASYPLSSPSIVFISCAVLPVVLLCPFCCVQPNSNSAARSTATNAGFMMPYPLLLPLQPRTRSAHLRVPCPQRPQQLFLRLYLQKFRHLH